MSKMEKWLSILRADMETHLKKLYLILGKTSLISLYFDHTNYRKFGITQTFI